MRSKVKLKKTLKFTTITLLFFMAFQCISNEAIFAFENEVINHNFTEEKIFDKEKIALNNVENYSLDKANILDNEYKSQINKATDWILSQKNENGVWGDEETETFYSSEVLSLESLLDNKINVDHIVEILEKSNYSNVDYTARILPYLKGEKKNIELTQLNKMRYDMLTYGVYAWGSQGGYGANPYDTSVTVKNILKAFPNNIDEIINGIFYLVYSQNEDGGWSYLASDESDVYLTAEVLLVIKDFYLGYSMSDETRNEIKKTMYKARDYLINQKDVDKYWGTTKNNLKASIQAYRALLIFRVGQDWDFYDELLSLQNSNGSFYDDVYLTTLATKALAESQIELDNINGRISSESEKSIVYNDKENQNLGLGILLKDFSNIDVKKVTLSISYDSMAFEFKEVQVINNNYNVSNITVTDKAISFVVTSNSAIPIDSELVKVILKPKKVGIHSFIFSSSIFEDGSGNKFDLALSVSRVHVLSNHKEDVNKDGVIDILDLAEISKLYNSNKVKFNWNNELDFNDDEVIDLYDLIRVAKKIS